MAVSIVSSPNPINSVDEDIIWELTISDLGTPGVTQKSIGYQLIDSLGRITAEGEIQPVSTSYEHPISLLAPIKQSLNTKIPNAQLNTVQDAYGVETYTLKYGEITLTLATGAISGFPLSSSSTAIKVVNCTNNNYFDELADMTAFKNLTYKPFNNWYCAESYDWLYVWGACTVTVLKGYSASGGGYTGTTVATLTGVADKVNCIPIGYRHLSGLSAEKTYMVKLSLNGVDTYYKYVKNFEPDEGQPCQIVYFDIAGGYQAIDFILTGVSPASRKDKYNTYRPYQSITQGGEQLANSRTQVRYSMKRLMPTDKDQQQQLIRFASAENYYLPLTTNVFEYGLVRFTFDGDINIEVESGEYLEVSGYLTHPLNSANGRQ